MKTPVTVLGLGAMGTALARAFLSAGHPVTVWNRTPGRSPELDALGAGRAASAAAAVAASPLVVVCLLVDATVRSTLDGVDLGGKTVVNLTNSTPEQARETAALLGAAEYLDGGIMAVPAMIGGPAAFIFYSGSAAAFEQHRDALEALARPEYVGADPGLAALYDIALLTGMYGVFAGATHALALAGSEQLAAGPFTERFLLPWLTAMLTSLPRIAKDLDGPRSETAGSNLAMQSAAYDNLIDTSVAQGIDPSLMEPMGELLRKAVAAGYGDADLAALVGVLRTAAG
ncbi:NAD(P)-binding domain-containing protein [Kribbella sp. NPDC000426]|uniref:NAD(P)-dependent oxidoreductase n=1 Tax=Kribbella sp. NPDC000426 TaxID=3154255 RepID=UPI0033236FF7